MYVVRNKEGLYMRLMVLPMTPSHRGYINERITVELATKYETEQEAHAQVAWLIKDMEEPPEKFEGYTVEKI